MKMEILGNSDTRSGFGAGLSYLGEKNPNVVALCADLTGSLKMNDFQNKFPERFFIIGSSDGKFWHSHVIWHISISIAQYYFLKTTFLINHTINFI